MVMEQATAVRKDWSAVCDSVIHEKPKFIKRTRDKMWFSNLDVMLQILEAYQFHAQKFIEPDGSVTLSMDEIDLVENGEDETAARTAMGGAILEYAYEYYENYTMYANAPNRKAHIPYVFKALIEDDAERIGKEIKCRAGRS